jgi:hypothetical protein
VGLLIHVATIFHRFLAVLVPDIAPLMGSDGLPSTYLVDPDGIECFQALGERPRDEEW